MLNNVVETKPNTTQLLISLLSFLADHDSAEVLLATALSMIPAVHGVPSKDLTMVRLASFAAWFKSAFQCLTDDPDQFPHPVEDWLMRAMENYICTSPAQRVILFLLSAR